MLLVASVEDFLLFGLLRCVQGVHCSVNCINSRDEYLVGGYGIVGSSGGGQSG